METMGEKRRMQQTPGLPWRNPQFLLLLQRVVLFDGGVLARQSRRAQCRQTEWAGLHAGRLASPDFGRKYERFADAASQRSSIWRSSNCCSIDGVDRKASHRMEMDEGTYSSAPIKIACKM
jgi:hypothetical protein